MQLSGWFPGGMIVQRRVRYPAARHTITLALNYEADTEQARRSREVGPEREDTTYDVNTVSQYPVVVLGRACSERPYRRRVSASRSAYVDS